MGRCKTNKYRAPAGMGNRQYRPLPKKDDIARLAKYREEYSPKLLANRIQSLTHKQRAELAKGCGVTKRTVARWRLPGLAEAPVSRYYSADVKAKARKLWAKLIKRLKHTASRDILQLDVRNALNIDVAPTTLARWTSDMKKPLAPAYNFPSNQPQCYQINLARGRYS